MEQEDRAAELIEELAIASKDTQGALGEMVEPMGLWHRAGISAE